MFWGSSKKKETEEREKTLKELRTSFPSIRRPNNDDTVYELLFEVNRQFSTLRIYIPTEYPVERPVLQVVGSVTNAWLDQYKRVVGCDKLINWQKTSSVTEVVQETLAQLQGGGGHPLAAGRPTSQHLHTSHPHPAGSHASHGSHSGHASAGNSTSMASHYMTQTQNGHRPSVDSGRVSSQSMSGPNNTNAAAGYHPAHRRHSNSQPPAYDSSVTPHSHHNGNGSSTNTHLSHAHTPNPPTPPPIPKTAIPPIPQSFSELSGMSEAQLQRLLTDNVALEAHIQGMPLTQGLVVTRNSLRESNAQLARDNMNKSDNLAALHSSAVEIQASLVSKAAAYRDLNSQYNAEFGVGKDDIVDQLNAAKDELDDASENIAQDFVAGDKELSLFLTEFLAERTKYHVLSAKIACGK